MTKKAEIAHLEDAFCERYEKAMKLSDKISANRKTAANKLLTAIMNRKLDKLTREKDEIRERLMVLYREGVAAK